MNKEIEDEIQRIADQNGGRITPDSVIEHARDETNVLHGLFNWDIEQAAMEHWRDRARDIIRSVKIEVRTERTVVEAVAYVRDPRTEHSEQGYVSTLVLRDDRHAAKQAILSEFGRAESALTRAREVAVALNVEEDVARLIERLGKVQRKVNKKAALAR